MSSAARDGRRRRLLHEGSSDQAGVSPQTSGDSEASTKVRYTPRPGSVSFAVATGVLPHSMAAIGSFVLIVMLAVAALAGADSYGIVLAQANQPGSAGFANLLLIDQPASLASWCLSAVWMGVAFLCVLLFGMRQHRTDDLRGGYRWWLLAAGFAFATSLSASTHAFAIIAGSLGVMTGWSPLSGDAVWTLIPGLLILTPVAVRMLMEMKESRLAITTGAFAIAFTVFGWSWSAGIAQRSLASVGSWVASPLVGPVVSLSVAMLTAVSLLFYARRIVLEAGGVVAPPVVKPKLASATKKEKLSVVASTTKAKEEEPEKPNTQRLTASQRRVMQKQAEAKKKAEKKEQTVWVSGGDGYEESYEEDQPKRRLTKAERKRLRKLKARNAA